MEGYPLVLITTTTNRKTGAGDIDASNIRTWVLKNTFFVLEPGKIAAVLDMYILLRSAQSLDPVSKDCEPRCF